MVVSSPSPFQPANGGTQLPAPSQKPSAATTYAEAIEASGPTCDLRSRGMGKFPPRLAREPRPQQSRHARVRLPKLPRRSQQQTHWGSVSRPIPPLTPEPPTRGKSHLSASGDEVVTLEMRPARSPVSGVWHRLRFNGFSAMNDQRRSQWKPGRRPKRGRPEGTKGAGSRSI